MGEVISIDRIPTPRSLEGILPPHDLTAESAVLGALMVEGKDRVSEVRHQLRGEMFFSGPHERIFTAILAVSERGEPLDFVTVGYELKAQDRLAEVGGTEGLIAHGRLVPSVDAMSLRAYAKIIHDTWKERCFLALGQRMVAEAYVDNGPVDPWADDWVRQFTAVARLRFSPEAGTNIAEIKAILLEITERHKNAAEGRAPRGLSTGLPSLDAMTGGLHASQKFTVVSLPGRGKSAFALHLARTVAESGKTVLFFTSEMTRRELLLRMISSYSGVNGLRLRNFDLRGDDDGKVVACLDKVARLPIEIFDSPGLNAWDIASTARQRGDALAAESKPPLGLVVVDYVQRLECPPWLAKKHRHEQIWLSSKALKSMAQSLKVAVVELAQQKPSKVDATTGKREKPSSGWVADSSGVEKESDAVIYLHRKATRGGGEDASVLECIVDKVRDGKIGEFDLEFDGATQRFSEAPTGPYYER